MAALREWVNEAGFRSCPWVSEPRCSGGGGSLGQPAAIYPGRSYGLRGSMHAYFALLCAVSWMHTSIFIKLIGWKAVSNCVIKMFSRAVDTFLLMVSEMTNFAILYEHISSIISLMLLILHHYCPVEARTLAQSQYIEV